MQGSKVYILSFWTTNGFEDFGHKVKVFATEKGANEYIKEHLYCDWHDDGFGELCRTYYTLVEEEVL